MFTFSDASNLDLGTHHKSMLFLTLTLLSSQVSSRLAWPDELVGLAVEVDDIDRQIFRSMWAVSGL